MTSDLPRRRGFLAEYPRTRVVILASVTIVLVGLAVQTINQAGVLLSSVLIPSAVAILLTGLLMPLQVLLNHRLRLPRMAAAALTILITLAFLAGIGTLVGTQLAEGVGEVGELASLQVQDIVNAIAGSSLPVDAAQVQSAMDQATTWLQENSSTIASSAIGVGTGAAGVLIGALLCLIATFFFLAEGDRLGTWAIMRLPRQWHERAYEASRRGWVTVGTYTKTQALVAAVDALGIGIGAAILGVPFVIPLTVLTFVLCFIPVVGAVVSGALFVLVALGSEGLTAAIIMLVIVVGVQQLESNLLQPVLMGKAVDIHPIVVLLGVAAGSYIMGLVGALFAVPAIATANTIASYLGGRDPFPGLARGGSALTDPPRKLLPEVSAESIPKRVGSVSPGWVDSRNSRRDRKIREVRHGDA
ncbi:AI-2E family transporter [Georgenia sp. Z1491]|uniref:AI-2E family transporter n=1 Tax=Georgenia sp. Z1491 TaxID=3416707 RepID=UPI003CF3429E